MRWVAKLFALAFAGGIALLGATRAEAMLLTQSVSFDVTLCVDVEGSKITAGTPVWAHPCNGTMAEQWNFVGSELQVLAPGRCLMTKGNLRVAGTPVILAGCSGAAGQRWGYDDQLVYLLGTDLCLDSEPGTDEQLVINKCSDSALTQQWTLH
jgi:endo-1,4-beta-xylanase